MFHSVMDFLNPDIIPGIKDSATNKIRITIKFQIMYGINKLFNLLFNLLIYTYALNKLTLQKKKYPEIAKNNGTDILENTFEIRKDNNVYSGKASLAIDIIPS